MNEDKPRDEKTQPESWYKRNKEQIKLIQYLLYWLQKHEQKIAQDAQTVKITNGSVEVHFD